MKLKMIAAVLAATCSMASTANAAFVIQATQQDGQQYVAESVADNGQQAGEINFIDRTAGGRQSTGNTVEQEAQGSVTGMNMDSYQNGKQKVTLAEAMQLVAPNGWRGYSDPTVNWKYPVEVNVYGDWKQSLAELSNRYNLIFQVNEKAKRVYVTTGAGGIRDNSGDKRIDGLVGELPRAGQYNANYDGQPFLQVRIGQRVPEALEMFLSQHDLKLIWEPGSQPVLRNDVNFNGPIEDILTELLQPLGYHATIYTPSRTVVVRTISQSVADARYNNGMYTH